MRTPQEIADDIYAQYENQHDNLILTPEGYKLDLVAAIEADRAQVKTRIRELIDTPGSGEYYRGWDAAAEQILSMLEEGDA